MAGTGTGLFGFADYTNPIIRPGYNRAKTDKVIGKFRKNEQDYLQRIKELEHDLQLALAQRNGLDEALGELCEDLKVDETEKMELILRHVRREKIEAGLDPDEKF